MNSLIELQQFSLQLQQQPVLRNLNLSLEKGQITALVGESGSGKSVTAMSICRLLEGNLQQAYQGQLLFRHNAISEDILQFDQAQLEQFRAHHVGFVFQDALMSLNPLHHIEKQLSEALHYSQHRNNDARQQIIHWLEKVGIKQPASRLRDFPHQFSGGEQQRIMIAMALIKQPQLLIADEATTALDVTVQKQILDLILQLKEELNLTVLFISHDLHVVKYIADKIAVMLNGEIVEQQAKQALLEQPQHPYTQSLLNSEYPADTHSCSMIKSYYLPSN